MKAAFVVMLLVAIALGVFSKVLYDRSTGSKLQADSLARVADTLRAEASALKARDSTLSASLDSVTTAASKEKEEEINRLKSTYDELEKSMKSEVEQGQIQITRLADRLKVSMVDRILFPSGDAEISPAGLKVLARVGKVLKDAQGKIIRVEGHTDNVAISPALQKKFASNWELSTTRATNVVRFLQDSVGIEPTRLWAVGFSEYHPVASNATPKGRSLNRRIEIGLIPEGN